MALYNVCEPTKSTMFDHGLGHIVPRDAENVRMLADVLQEVIPKVEEENRREEAAMQSNQQQPIGGGTGRVGKESAASSLVVGTSPRASADD